MISNYNYILFYNYISNRSTVFNLRILYETLALDQHLHLRFPSILNLIRV